MAAYRTKAALVMAVDDTDCPGQGGTGSVAREIARRLAPDCALWGISRHQFAVLPEIPYTARNSGNVIHLLTAPSDLEALADRVAFWLGELALPGSDPALCVARPDAVAGLEVGRAAQRRVVGKDEVRAAAREAGAILRHVAGTDNGIVGALAGACLAAGGDDGRLIQVGSMRDLKGRVDVTDVLAAGGDEVRSLEGERLTAGPLLADRLRPALREGRCVLYCVPGGDGAWVPLKGAPGDAEREGRPDGTG